jgi:hypothetical protein
MNCASKVVTPTSVNPVVVHVPSLHTVELDVILHEPLGSSSQVNFNSEIKSNQKSSQRKAGHSLNKSCVSDLGMDTLGLA